MYFSTPWEAIASFEHKSRYFKIKSWCNSVVMLLWCVFRHLYVIITCQQHKFMTSSSFTTLSPTGVTTNTFDNYRLVVCLHGLHGHPVNFSDFLQCLQKHYSENNKHLLPPTLYIPKLDSHKKKMNDIIRPLVQHLVQWIQLVPPSSPSPSEEEQQQQQQQQQVLNERQLSQMGKKKKEIVIIGVSNGARLGRALMARLVSLHFYELQQLGRIRFISIVGACRGSSMIPLVKQLGGVDLSWLFFNKTVVDELAPNSNSLQELEKAWQEAMTWMQYFERDYVFFGAAHDWEIPNYDSTLMSMDNTSRKENMLARYVVIPGHGHLSACAHVTRDLVNLISETD
jgi:hypothetical protein